MGEQADAKARGIHSGSSRRGNKRKEVILGITRRADNVAKEERKVFCSGLRSCQETANDNIAAALIEHSRPQAQLHE